MTNSVEQSHPEAEPPSTEESVKGAVLSYLRLLWPDGVPDGTSIVLFGPKTGVCVSPTLEAAAAAWPRLEAKAQASDESLYLTTAAMRGGLPRRSRGGADDVRALPGLLLDLDHRYGKHKDAEKCQTPERILEALDGLMHPPSYVLDSGGGFYAAWLLDEPWEPGDAFNAPSALLGLQSGLQGLLGTRAGIEGADLARVLRPVGGRNHKYGNRVRMIRGGDDPVRYSPSDLEELVSTLPEAPPPAAGDQGATASITIRSGQGVLPAADWVRVALQGLSGPMKPKKVGDQITAWIPHVCPACGGVSVKQNPGQIDLGTGWVSAASGRLRCWRRSCAAGDLNTGVQVLKGENGKDKKPQPAGLPFKAWGWRYLPSEVYAAAMLQREAERPADRDEPDPITTAPEEDWPSFNLDSDELSGLIDGWINEASQDPRNLHLREVPGGCGKTHGLARSIAQGFVTAANPQPVGSAATWSGESIGKRRPGDMAVLFRSHRDAEDWTAMLRQECERLGVEPRVRHVRGVGNLIEGDPKRPACVRREEWIEGGNRAAAMVRQTLCGGCPHRSSCEVVRKPGRDELLVGVVHGVEAMVQQRFLDRRLVIFDETPAATATVTVSTTTAAHVRDLQQGYGAKGRSKNDRRERMKAARCFGSAVGALRDALADEDLETARTSRYDNGRALGAVVGLLSEQERTSLVSAAKTLAKIPRAQMPTWDPATGPTGCETVIHPVEVESLWKALTWLDHKGERSTHQATAQLVVPPAGDAWFEVISAQPWVHLLEDREGMDTDENGMRVRVTIRPAGVLVLSATARNAQEQLEAVLPSGSTAVVSGAQPITNGELERMAVLYADASVRSTLSKGLLRRKPEAKQPVLADLLDGALTAFRAQVGDAWDELRDGLGVITYRQAVYAFMPNDQDDREEAQGDREAVAAVLEKHGASLATATDRIRSGRPAVGYWGRDDTASNAFREVKVLLLLGQPTPNLGAMDRRGEALGLDGVVVRAQHERDAIAQAVYRLRHVRRGRRVYAVGVFRTVPSVDRETWEVIRRPSLANSGDEKRELLEELLDAARRGEVLLSSVPVRDWLAARGHLTSTLSKEEDSALKLNPLTQRAQRLIASAATLLADDGWEVRSAKTGARGRPWKVLARAETDQEDLEAQVREYLENPHLAAQSADALPGAPTHARAREAAALSSPLPTMGELVAEARADASDPRLVEDGLSVVDLMIEWFGLPELSDDDTRRLAWEEGLPGKHFMTLFHSVTPQVRKAFEGVEVPVKMVSGILVSPKSSEWGLLEPSERAWRGLVRMAAYRTAKRVMVRHMRRHGPELRQALDRETGILAVAPGRAAPF